MFQLLVRKTENVLSLWRQRALRTSIFVKHIILVPAIDRVEVYDFTLLRRECARLKLNDQIPFQTMSA